MVLILFEKKLALVVHAQHLIGHWFTAHTVYFHNNSVCL